MGVSGNFNITPESPKRFDPSSRIVRIVGKEREDMLVALQQRGMSLEEANIEIAKKEIAATNKLAA